MLTLIRLTSFIFGIAILTITGMLTIQHRETTAYWMLVYERDEKLGTFAYSLMSPDGKIQRTIQREERFSSGLGFVGNSPDGEWIFFTDNEGNRGNGLWRMRLNGSQRELLINDSFALNMGALQWSPDGKWLAVSTFDPQSRNDDEGSIYVVRHDGEEVRKITPPETGEIISSFWSLDSKWIVYSERREDGDYNHSVQIDGIDQPNDEFSTQISLPPLWSPDGHAYIDYEESSESWVLHRLHENVSQVLSVSGFVDGWLTNDSVLALDYEESAGDQLQTLYRYDISSEKRTIYGQYPANLGFWGLWWEVSPTREWVLVGISPQSGESTFYTFTVATDARYELHLDGGQRMPTRLPQNMRMLVSQPLSKLTTFFSFNGSIIWGKDDKWLIWESTETNDRSIYKLRPDGTDRQVLYSLKDSPFGEVQVAVVNKWLLVSYLETFGSFTYDRLVRVNIDNGAVEHLAQGKLLTYMPIVEKTWSGTSWFAIGLALTAIPLLVRVFDRIRTQKQPESEGQPMFWIAPYKVSIFPMWPDLPQA